MIQLVTASKMGLAIFVACGYSVLVALVFILKKMYDAEVKKYYTIKSAYDSAKEENEHYEEVIQTLKDKMYNAVTNDVESRLNFMRDSD